MEKYIDEITFIIKLIREDFSKELKYDTCELDLNWIISFLSEHRILQYAYDYLLQISNNQERKVLDEKQNEHKSKAHNSLNELVRFSKLAREEKVKFILVKGFGLSYLLYNNIYARYTNDIDILVEADDMIRADFILKKMGYIQPNTIDFSTKNYTELSYPIMRLKHTNHFFEYYNLNLSPVTKFELHKRLYFINDLNINDFLWNFSSVDIGEVKVNILDLEYTFVFLVINAYQNTETLFSLQRGCIIREYIDLFRFLHLYKETMNWLKVKYIIDKLKVQSKVRKVFLNLSNLYNVDYVDEYSCIVNDMDLNEDEWDIGVTFIEKLFNVEKTKEKIFLLQKQYAFNPMKSRIKIKKAGLQYQLLKLETKHDVVINYALDYTKALINLHLFIPDVVRANLENYLFQFIIYNNVQSSPYLYTLLEIVYEDNKVVSYIINTPILRDSNVLRKQNRGKRVECVDDNNEIIATINFADMGLCFEEVLGKLAFSFNWFKYVQPLTYHHMEDSPRSLYESFPIDLD